MTMEQRCSHCSDPLDNQVICHEPMTGEPLCRSCLATLYRQEYIREIEGEDLQTLRGRVISSLDDEDTLRQIASNLAARDIIDVADLI